MTKKQKILLSVAFGLLVVAAAFAVWQGRQSDDRVTNHDLTRVEPTEPIKKSWRVYRNEKFQFQFSYPDDLILAESPVETFHSEGEVLSLVVKDADRLMKGGQLHPSVSRRVVISYWENINLALDGDWEGRRTYKNLKDFFEDPNPLISKKVIEEVRVGGLQAYRVSMGGSIGSEAVMIERAGKIYEIELRFDNDSVSREVEKNILRSFRFWD